MATQQNRSTDGPWDGPYRTTPPTVREVGRRRARSVVTGVVIAAVAGSVGLAGVVAVTHPAGGGAASTSGTGSAPGATGSAQDDTDSARGDSGQDDTGSAWDPSGTPVHGGHSGRSGGSATSGGS